MITEQKLILQAIGMMKVLAKNKKKIGKSLLFGAFTLFILFYILIYKSFNKRAYREDTFFVDKGVLNKVNEDNIIYKGGKKFYYTVTLEKSQNIVLLHLKDYNTTSFDPKSSYDEENVYINTIRLNVFENTNTNFLDGQTLIKYDYMNKDRVIGRLSEVTGIIEDSTMVYVHPPRGLGFTFLEITPFPVVNLPLELGKTWRNNLTIPKETQLHYNINEAVVGANYTIVNKKIIDTKVEKNIECYVIEAESLNSKNQTIATTKYYFSPKLGFVKMIIIYKDLKLTLNLSKIE